MSFERRALGVGVRCEVSALELARLNFYRASELQGGLVLGQLVRRVRDAELIAELTRHSAEEVVHAQLWTETILAVGGTPRPVRDTYQSYYARALGAPASVLQVLAKQNLPDLPSTIKIAEKRGEQPPRGFHRVTLAELAASLA